MKIREEEKQSETPNTQLLPFLLCTLHTQLQSHKHQANTKYKKKKKHTDELNLKAANERRKAKQRKKEFPPNSLRGFFSLSFVRHYKYNIINAAI